MTRKLNDVKTWKLAKPHAAEAQGIVVSGYGHLPISRTLLLHFEWDETARGGSWLKALDRVAPVTPADGKRDPSVALGITATGLRKMGVPKSVLDGFSAPFLEGMFQVDRMRRLNDRVGTEWSGSVIEGGPLWSANTPPAEVAADDGLLSSLPRRDDTTITTPITVDAILLLHCKTSEEATALAERTGEVLAQNHVAVVRSKETTLGFDENGLVREHFGYVDGLSQPIAWDADAIANAAPEPDPINGIALGEVLMGHLDGHHEITTGPLVSKDRTVAFDPDDSDNLDLSLNSSYLVVRELRQDVAGLWNNAAQVAAGLGNDPETRKPRDSKWVSERVIGRSMDGDILRPDGVAPRTDPKIPDNDFLFFDEDRHGLGCPLGSHVRRGNPRDGLSTKPSQKASLLASSNSHRILRRARKYGPYIEDRMVDDGVERGLMFCVVNADIQRQFEFVQQIWMMSPSFGTLFDETDPLLGPTTVMTLPADPVRHRITIDNHVKLAGGEYFFLPSLPAIQWLSDL